MANFWEIAARSVNNLFSLYFVYLLYLFISRFGFKSGICLLIASVPVHCFSITFITHSILSVLLLVKELIFIFLFGCRLWLNRQFESNIIGTPNAQMA